MKRREELLEMLNQLIEKDKTNKRHQENLNREISLFISEELGIKGPATLLDISKRLLEMPADEPRIITP